MSLKQPKPDQYTKAARPPREPEPEPEGEWQESTLSRASLKLIAARNDRPVRVKVVTEWWLMAFVLTLLAIIGVGTATGLFYKW